MLPASIRLAVKKEVDEYRAHELKAHRRLWHRRMKVLVPQYASLTPTQLEYYGSCYNTGMTVAERDAYNKEMVYMWMSPIRQIALYAEGIPIAYPNRMIAVEVYKDIKQHVQNWKELLTTSLNRRVKAPPYEDFELMLEFAEHLEVYLEYYYKHLDKKREIEPFHKRTMNSFINSDRYMYREDSTYHKLKEGIYSFTGDRVARKETTRAPVSQSVSDPSHYQDLPTLGEDDFSSMMSSIRGES